MWALVWIPKYRVIRNPFYEFIDISQNRVNFAHNIILGQISTAVCYIAQIQLISKCICTTCRFIPSRDCLCLFSQPAFDGFSYLFYHLPLFQRHHLSHLHLQCHHPWLSIVFSLLACEQKIFYWWLPDGIAFYGEQFLIVWKMQPYVGDLLHSYPILPYQYLRYIIRKSVLAFQS